MALSASKISSRQVVIDRIGSNHLCQSLHHVWANTSTLKTKCRNPNNLYLSGAKLSFTSDNIGCICKKPNGCKSPRTPAISCMSTGTRNGGTKEISRKSGTSQFSNQNARGNTEMEYYSNEHQVKRTSSPGLSEACKFAYNDAKFVNERARQDIVLLSRGITRLNNRARQDVAVIGMKFLKLDARAREDTEKIDNDVKKKAARLHHIAIILKDKAQSKLKRAADQHWSDGALEADLRRADIIAKRRAMEDAYMALQFVRNIHDMMVNKQLPKDDGYMSVNNVMGYVTLQTNGKPFDPFPGDISSDRIAAIQDAYLSMASALSEADGIDYTDPDELELLVATLIDLDAMDGKSSVSLLAECSSSPDVSTRKALANALATAPSMWILGNAGMGALQRLAADNNPAVAAAASKAIDELRRQWEIQEGDDLRFMMNQNNPAEDSQKSASDSDGL